MCICEFDPNSPCVNIKCNRKKAIATALRMELYRGFSPKEVEDMLCSTQTTAGQRFKDCPAVGSLIAFGRSSEFAISPLSDPEFL